MRGVFILSGVILVLAGCSAQQQQTAATDVAVACTVLSAAEAAAPNLTKHNVTVANGITYACDTAPAAEALVSAFSAGKVPVVTAATAPQTVSVATHPN